MRSAPGVGSVLSGVAVESARYWVRRNRALLVGVAGVALLSAAVAVAGQTERSRDIIVLAFWGPLVAGVLTMSGVVSSELESGLVGMWFQKRGTLVRPYLIRYGINQALVVAFALAVAAVVSGVGAAAGLWAAEKALRLPLVALATAVIPASMVFALSAWGVRRDASVAVIVLITSTALAGVTAFDAGRVARIVRALAFPLDAIQTLSGPSPVGQTLGQALAVVVGHILAWSAVGVVGLWYTEGALRRGR